ncbi:MAG: hypothetical protein ACTHKG_04485 [Nocardioides sp.]
MRSLAATTLAAALAASVPLDDATGADTALSPCVNPDNGVPVVEDVALSSAAVDVTDAARSVDVTMQVADTAGPGPASGVWHVSAALAPPGGVPELPVDLERVAGTTWSARVTVPRGAPEGDYTFRGLRVLDRAGNEPAEEYRDQALASAPFAGTALRVSSSARDVAPPALTGVSVGPQRVDTRRKARHVRVVARVTDDVSGVAAVTATLRGHGELISVDLHERDGAWAGRATISRWLGRKPDRWRLRSVSVVDRVRNRDFLGHRAVEGLGATTFKVRSGPRDRHEPRIRSARFGPHDVDVRVDRDRVRFVVRVSDDRSGVRSVQAGVPGHWATLHRTSGTARRGTWKGSTVFRPCNPRLESSQVRVVALDQVWNEAHEGVGRLRVRARDTVPPRVALESPTWAAGGPVRLQFDEPVRGISVDSVIVRKYDYPFLGEPIAGRWSCADENGGPSDCVTGAVRRATWTPDGSLPEGSDFLVELNPSGNLDVMDLSGNPFRRTIRYGRS